MIQTRYAKAISILILMHWVNTSMAAVDDGSRAAARELVNSGAKDYKAGHFDVALTKFNDALAIAEVPTVAVWAAQANEKLGRLLAAQRLYTNALLMSKSELWVGTIQQEAQKKAQKALAELEPRIPKLTVTFEGVTSTSSLEVSIDGERIKNEALRAEFPVEPGEHEIIAKEGLSSAKGTVLCSEGKHSAITLTLRRTEPAPTSAATKNNPRLADDQSLRLDRTTANPVTSEHPNSRGKGQRDAGWIITGFGAAGVVVGITTGIAAGIKRSSLHADGCTGNDCVGSRYKDRIDSYNALRTVSGVSFVVGGIAAAAGVTLLLTSPRREPGTTIGVAIAPGQVGLVGTY